MPIVRFVRRGAGVPDFLRIFQLVRAQGRFLSPLVPIIEHMFEPLENILSQFDAMTACQAMDERLEHLAVAHSIR